MDGCESLVLSEAAPPVIYGGFSREKNAVKTIALLHVGREYKISTGYNPGDKRKEPGTKQTGKPGKNIVPETAHQCPCPKIRAQMSLEKVAELRMKSTQGRKWLIRTPGG